MRYENQWAFYLWIGICVAIPIVLTIMFGFGGLFFSIIIVGAGVLGWIAEDRRMMEEYRRMDEEEQRRNEKEY